MSNDEIAEFLTLGNGFNKGATYRGDYLNSLDGIGYRGMSIERNSINPDQTISIGGDGSSSQIVVGTTLLPFSPTNDWNMKLWIKRVKNTSWIFSKICFRVNNR